MVHPFELVADPVRRRIIEVLAVGDHPVGILNDVISMEFGISRSAVSHHLRILRDARAVSVHAGVESPQERRYLLEEEFLERLDDAVGSLFELFDHRYGSLVRRAPMFAVAPPSRVPHAHRLGRKGLRGRRTDLPPARET